VLRACRAVARARTADEFSRDFARLLGARRAPRGSASANRASRKKRRGRKKTLTFNFATRKFALTKGGDSAMAKKKAAAKKSSKKSTTKKSSKK
jgi:hypothetical protein